MTLFPNLPPREKPAKRQTSGGLPGIFLELFKPGAYLEEYRLGGPKAFKVYDKQRRPLGYVNGETGGDAQRRGVVKEILTGDARQPARFIISRKGIRALRGNDKFKRAYLAHFQQQQNKKRLTPCTSGAIIPAVSKITR